MLILLIFIILLLLGIIIYLLKARQSRSQQIIYLTEQLKRIMTSQTNEKLLLVTDDKQLIALLMEMNQLLENSRHESAAFNRMEMSIKKMIANISHDLKTPLTVVLGYLETLNQDTEMVSDERQILITKVHKKAEEVLELIHKFFDLARIESGDKEIPLSRIDINEVCQRNILQFYDILTVKGFTVEIHIPDKSIHILSNEEALDRIMNNLISNAIHHGGDGEYIGLALDEDEAFVYIRIWDKGKGIDEHHLDRVFERMFTLDDSRNKSNQGSGLGLTITKRLVQNIGGTIRLSSEPYVQTLFTIQLPKMKY